MGTSEEELKLDLFEHKLAQFEELRSIILSHRMLDLLVTRDAIQKELISSDCFSPQSILRLENLDNRLKATAKGLDRVLPIANWRATRKPCKEDWWWFLLSEGEPAQKLDWLINVLSLVFFTISLSLLIDISTRFFQGGSDFNGIAFIIAQAILTMFAAGGTLSKVGQDLFERVFSSIHIEQELWHIIRFGFAGVVLVILISVRLLLPQFAIFYNNRGVIQNQAGRFMNAQYDYKRALSLNPDYPEAHYNLGSLYEDLQEIENAKTEYRIAAEAGMDEASNNLAHLYILEKKYDAAVPLLQASLDRKTYAGVRYDLLKNMAWARIGQTRYSEAEVLLLDALALDKLKAPAHCLLAQVYEQQQNQDGAEKEWGECLDSANTRNTDEDAWLGKARQYMNERGR